MAICHSLEALLGSALIFRTIRSLTLLLCSCGFAWGAPGDIPPGCVNYPANFQVDAGIDLFVTGEYLYWRVSEDGLCLVQTGARHSPAGFDGRIQRIDPGWQSGMRLGTGLNFPKEGYDTALYWTQVSAVEHESAHSHRGTLIPLWAEPDLPKFAGAGSARGKWDLDLNLLDWEWGRSSWFGGNLSLRPFFGLRAAWIDQALKNQFTFKTHPVSRSHLHAKSDFRGGGLRAGLGSRFTLPHGFALYGLASGALLYGQCDASLRVREGKGLIAHTRDTFWRGIPSLQMGLGIGWDTHFAKDHLHIEFHVGWEQNLWFGLNQMNHYLHTLNSGFYFKENGNLSTQGLVAGGRFDF